MEAKSVTQISYSWTSVHTLLPAEVISAAEALLMEAVRLQTLHLLVGAGGYDGFPPPLTAQGVGTGAEQDTQAVLLRYPLQEASQGPVTLVLVASVGPGHPFGAGQDILWPQRATLLIQAAVLCCLQTLILTIQLHESWSWRGWGKVQLVRHKTPVCAESSEEGI